MRRSSEKSRLKSIVFTGGGTGGHVFPGIAVAEALRERIDLDEHRIVWIGSTAGMEREIVERFSIPFYGIPAGKLRRYFSLQNLLDVGKVVAGYGAALALLKKLNAVHLFSKGGFVSVPPVVAARSLGIPAMSHESDLDPGLATRINARFCTSILCAYEQTASMPSLASKAVVTGNPVRAELFRGDPREGRRIAGIPEGRPMVLVLGGSQGARQINDLISPILGRLLETASVVHQMGHQLRMPDTIPGRYLPAAMFTEEFPHLLAAADLVISRAGAGTLWENGVLGKAAILVPLGAESSRGDQLRNASFFAGRGAADLLSGEEMKPEILLEKSLDLLKDDERRKSMGRNAASLCPGDAAQRIVEEILGSIGV